MWFGYRGYSAASDGHATSGCQILLEAEQASLFCQDLPQLRWVQTQREGLGIESYLYSFMRIAGASRILQWGFDETTLDGVSVLNQWALLEFPMAEGGGNGEKQRDPIS